MVCSLFYMVWTLASILVHCAAFYIKERTIKILPVPALITEGGVVLQMVKKYHENINLCLLIIIQFSLFEFLLQYPFMCWDMRNLKTKIRLSSFLFLTWCRAFFCIQEIGKPDFYDMHFLNVLEINGIGLVHRIQAKSSCCNNKLPRICSHFPVSLCRLFVHPGSQSRHSSTLSANKSIRSLRIAVTVPWSAPLRRSPLL